MPYILESIPYEPIKPLCMPRRTDKGQFELWGQCIFSCGRLFAFHLKHFELQLFSGVDFPKTLA